MSGDDWYHYSSELQWVVFLAIDKHIKMNKFLAISCMAVAAMAAPEAEADPYLLYGGYGGYGHGLGAYGAYGLGAYGAYGHGLGAYGYAHAAPVVASGYASVSPSASVHIAGLAGHHGYAGYAGYGGLGYAGLGYSGLGYNYGLGYGHYAHAGLGHAVAAPVAVAA